MQSGNSFARVEILFDDSFQSIRDMLMNGEEIRPFAKRTLADLIPADVLATVNQAPA